MFLFLETFLYLQYSDNLSAMRYFETRFMEEANQFVAQFDKKTIKKFYITSIWQNKPMTQLFLKNFKMISGSSELSMPDFKSDSWHFGINRITKRHWLSQHMVLSKKSTKSLQMKLSGQLD